MMTQEELKRWTLAAKILKQDLDEQLARLLEEDGFVEEAKAIREELYKEEK